MNVSWENLAFESYFQMKEACRVDIFLTIFLPRIDAAGIK
jgi:hypothetical protein